VAISDMGLGMAEDRLEVLRQGDGLSTTKSDGMGVGTRLIFNLIYDVLQGFIKVSAKEKAEGTGLKYRILIPIGAQEARAEARLKIAKYIVGTLAAATPLAVSVLLIANLNRGDKVTTPTVSIRRESDEDRELKRLVAKAFEFLESKDSEDRILARGILLKMLQDPQLRLSVKVQLEGAQQKASSTTQQEIKSLLDEADRSRPESRAIEVVTEVDSKIMTRMRNQENQPNALSERFIKRLENEFGIVAQVLNVQGAFYVESIDYSNIKSKDWVKLRFREAYEYRPILAPEEFPTFELPPVEERILISDAGENFTVYLAIINVKGAEFPAIIKVTKRPAFSEFNSRYNAELGEELENAQSLAIAGISPHVHGVSRDSFNNPIAYAMQIVPGKETIGGRDLAAVFARAQEIGLNLQHMIWVETIEDGSVPLDAGGARAIEPQYSAFKAKNEANWRRKQERAEARQIINVVAGDRDRPLVSIKTQSGKSVDIRNPAKGRSFLNYFLYVDDTPDGKISLLIDEQGILRRADLITETNEPTRREINNWFQKRVGKPWTVESLKSELRGITTTEIGNLQVEVGTTESQGPRAEVRAILANRTTLSTGLALAPRYDLDRAINEFDVLPAINKAGGFRHIQEAIEIGSDPAEAIVGVTALLHHHAEAPEALAELRNEILFHAFFHLPAVRENMARGLSQRFGIKTETMLEWLKKAENYEPIKTVDGQIDVRFAGDPNYTLEFQRGLGLSALVFAIRERITVQEQDRALLDPQWDAARKWLAGQILSEITNADNLLNVIPSELYLLRALYGITKTHYSESPERQRRYYWRPESVAFLINERPFESRLDDDLGKVIFSPEKRSETRALNVGTKIQIGNPEELDSIFLGIELRDQLGFDIRNQNPSLVVSVSFALGLAENRAEVRKIADLVAIRNSHPKLNEIRQRHRHSPFLNASGKLYIAADEYPTVSELQYIGGILPLNKNIQIEFLIKTVKEPSDEIVALVQSIQNRMDFKKTKIGMRLKLNAAKPATYKRQLEKALQNSSSKQSATAKAPNVSLLVYPNLKGDVDSTLFRVNVIYTEIGSNYEDPKRQIAQIGVSGQTPGMKHEELSPEAKQALEKLDLNSFQIIPSGLDGFINAKLLSDLLSAFEASKSA
jgi:hypothetical protein